MHPPRQLLGARAPPVRHGARRALQQVQKGRVLPAGQLVAAGGADQEGLEGDVDGEAAVGGVGEVGDAGGGGGGEGGEEGGVRAREGGEGAVEGGEVGVYGCGGGLAGSCDWEEEK